MARPLAPALVAVAMVASGCGGGGGGDGAGTVPAPEGARTAVADFAKAFGAGDGAKSCALLTPAARAAFLKRVQSLVSTTDCAAAIKRVHDAAGSQVSSAFMTAQVGAVKVSGETATAQLTASGHATTVHLMEQGGDWKLISLPGA